MTNDSYLNTCKELDDLAIRMLRLMKEYIDAKVTLEDLIKSGSLDLAKSRYIMGNKSVSVLQLPTEDSSEFTASARIISSQDKEANKLAYELSRISLKDISDPKIRSRHSKSKSSTTEQEEDVQTEVSIPDPLKWFGVLVPQNMRQAQASFSKALEYVIQCANIQSEMEQLQKQYKQKLSVKEEIKSGSG